MLTHSEITVIPAADARQSVRKWLLWALGAYIAGVITGSAYFMVEGVFALISDLTAVLMGVTMIPVVIGLSRIFESLGIRQVGIMRAVGLTGFTLLALGGLVLVGFYFNRSLPGGIALAAQFAGIFLQGVWLILVGWIMLKGGFPARKAAWAGILSGGGYFLIGAASTLGLNSLVMVIAALAVISYILWTLWLRSALKPA